MRYHKLACKSSSNDSEGAKGKIIKRVFLAISVVSIIIYAIIMFEELCIASYEYSGNNPYRSLQPMVIVAFLIIVQFICIILNLILKKWLNARNLLDDRERKLGSIPICLLWFNVLLAIILVLIVNIANGNIAQLISRVK